MFGVGVMTGLNPDENKNNFKELIIWWKAKVAANKKGKDVTDVEVVMPVSIVSTPKIV